MISIQVSTLVSGQAVLAGAGAGAALLGKLISSRPQLTSPGVIVLDFAGIEVGTSSFLREGVLAFRDYCRATSNAYPVVANLSELLREELTALLIQRGDALVCCDLSQSQISNPIVLGVLEAKQREILDLIADKESVNAPDLARQFSEEQVGPTAWNNRLSGLAKKSLLISRQSGRSTFFSPVIKGMKYGP